MKGPERYMLHVCEDCGEPAHGPGSRCGKDRRRTWTKMEEVEYIRADRAVVLDDELLTMLDRRAERSNLDRAGYVRWMLTGMMPSS
jgi:hypothetical protein